MCKCKYTGRRGPGKGTRSAESARAAGDVFGISVVFADHEQLVT
jgi:hypothetical protein